MSQENVEIVRRVYDALNRKDLSAVLALASPDMEWHPNQEDPEQRIQRGRDEVEAAFRDLWEALDELCSEPEEVISSGENVLVVVRHRARGRGSGVKVERREVHLWTVRDGAVVRLAEFPEKQAALEAAGLEE